MNRVIAILFVVLFASCHSNPDRKKEVAPDEPAKLPTKAEIAHRFNGYDSIKFYEDADWISLKGRNEITDDTLHYPFICYSFYKGYFDMSLLFSRNKDVRWRIRNKDGQQVLHLKKYVGGDIQDTVHNFFFFKDKENLFTDCSYGADKNHVKIRIITKTTQLDPVSIKEQYYFSNSGMEEVNMKEVMGFPGPVVE